MGLPSFLDYLTTEDHNFLATLISNRKEFDYLFTTDELYQKCLERIRVGNSLELIEGALFLTIHSLFYSVMLSIFRAEISSSFMFLRKAIESSLYAYYLTKNSSKLNVYLDRNHKEYGRFKKINKTIENDIDNYKLAKPLLTIYDLGNQYGVHATFESFKDQLEVTKDKDIQSLQLNYFKKISYDDFKFYFYNFDLCFLVILEIYIDEIFKFKIIEPEFDAKFRKLRKSTADQAQFWRDKIRLDKN